MSAVQLAYLKSDVAALLPEHDPQVHAERAVDDIVDGVSTLIVLPHVLGCREIDDLKLTVSRLTAYLKLAEVAS